MFPLIRTVLNRDSNRGGRGYYIYLFRIWEIRAQECNVINCWAVGSRGLGFIEA